MAFDGVNIGSHPPSLVQYSVSMAITFLIFILVDYANRSDYGRCWKAVILFEVFLVWNYVFFAVYPVNNPWVIALVSILMCCFMGIAGSTAYYSDKIADIGHLCVLKTKQCSVSMLAWLRKCFRNRNDTPSQ
jgi:hypothetical protein